MTAPFHIVFAIYPGMTHLDFTGPHQVLGRLPGAVVTVASRDGGVVEADGLAFAGTTPLAEVEACDLLCVPGGFAATTVAGDPAFLDEIRRLAGRARYVTSVCTGSLILGAAGLLQGRRAACHWAWRDLLALFGAVPDAGRVVRDGRLITGGGVTAGVDFAFTVVADIAGRDMAEMIQLGLEYAPQPPFECGRPELARPEILMRYNAHLAPRMARGRAEAEALGRVQPDIEDGSRVGEGAH
jgi:transcriptional regulator GlxA family with amidase domain